jgi:Tfp pilus assembly protein PilX
MKELFSFLWQKKKFWLIPVIIILVIIGFLGVVAAGSALSPFVYPLF